MADLYLKQGKQYSVGRPTYPPQLFHFIASKTPSHDLVWDVGTGSGQAAITVSLLPSYIFKPNFLHSFLIFLNSTLLFITHFHVELYLGCCLDLNVIGFSFFL